MTARGGMLITLVAAVLFGAVIALHIHGVVSGAARPPHVDETEYLHAGWMMRNGERLYETFFEHHSPFLFATLASLAPEGETLPARPFFVRARWLAGAAGLIAIVAFAATLLPSAREAPALAAALLFATGDLWSRGFSEVRAEAFSLAFFWLGALLVMRRRGWLSGLGLACVVASAVWNPKWPLSCLLVGLIWLFRTRTRFGGWLGALGGIAIVACVLRLIVPFDLWWFFNFDVNVALTETVRNTPGILERYFAGGERFLYAPAVFRPILVVPAALVVMGAWMVQRKLDRLWPVLLLVAAFLELRFLLPWPGLWTHYYLMWSIASASVLALVPSAIEILIESLRRNERLAFTARLLVICGAVVVQAGHLAAASTRVSTSGPYWVSERYLRERLKPGDRVWLEPQRHPVTVRDAHYYWFLLPQMTSAAAQLRETPRGRRYLPPVEPFPVCDPAVNLKFTMGFRGEELPRAVSCFEALVSSGAVRPTPFAGVWQVR